MPILGWHPWRKCESLPLYGHLLRRTSSLRVFLRAPIDFAQGKLSPALPRACLEPRLELDRSLEMFVSKLDHSKGLQPEADHPMVKRIVGSELVGLIFVSDRGVHLLFSGDPRDVNLRAFCLRLGRPDLEHGNLCPKSERERDPLGHDV